MWEGFWHWLFSGVLPEVSEQWDYAMITLIVRFVGVFVVMATMQVALQASARVVRALEKRRTGREEPKLAPAPAEPTETNTGPAKESALDDATVAAIGLALALESRQPTPASPAGGPSAWSSASRMRQPPRSPRR